MYYRHHSETTSWLCDRGLGPERPVLMFICGNSLWTGWNEAYHLSAGDGGRKNQDRSPFKRTASAVRSTSIWGA